MLVIADTSPLNYLILIDALEFLPRLYPQVILPRGAWQELQNADAPPPVKLWAQALPDWIEVREAPPQSTRISKRSGRANRKPLLSRSRTGTNRTSFYCWMSEPHVSRPPRGRLRRPGLLAS